MKRLALFLAFFAFVVNTFLESMQLGTDNIELIIIVAVNTML